MYFLRKEPYKKTIPEIHKTNGEVIPAREYMTDDRAIYKHHNFSRFYRANFHGIGEKSQGMKLYTRKTLKTILALRDGIHDYCGEWFDVYDESGIVHGEWEEN